MDEFQVLGKIIIPSNENEKMLLDIESKAPEEACGLLAGKFGANYAQAVFAIPMTNMLSSPYRYRLDPKEQFEAFNWIENQGLELVGIYHSHPTGSPYPSETDISEAYYPEAVHLIWARHDQGWIRDAYLIKENKVLRISIQDLPIEQL